MGKIKKAAPHLMVLCPVLSGFGNKDTEKEDMIHVAVEKKEERGVRCSHHKCGGYMITLTWCCQGYYSIISDADARCHFSNRSDPYRYHSVFPMPEETGNLTDLELLITKHEEAGDHHKGEEKYEY